MRAAHTPGPWYSVARLSASENHKGYLIGGGDPNERIAEVYPIDEDGIKGGANAILLAAAPELLAELQMAHQLLQLALKHMGGERQSLFAAESERAGLGVDGATRYHERAAVIAKALGSAT
jgi:hypothetical protein